jgi:Ca2+-binding RTX toxin-like protein
VTDGAILRPDGSDLIFGGSGLHTVRDDDTNIGTLAQQHARDADTICGDNCDIVRIVGFNGLDVANGKDLNNPATPRYVSFVYDNYDCAAGQAVCGEPNGYDPNGRIVVRGTTLLDYTPGGPDFRPDLFGANTGTCANGSPASGPCSNPIPLCSGSGAGTSRYVDIGGRDEIHGETGNDTAYGACGNDVLYGDAQDDELYGNWGADWISAGTGIDGVLGDDGRLLTSRNSITGYTWDNAKATWVSAGCSSTTANWNTSTCLTEPMYGIKALVATDPDTKTAQGNVINEFTYTPGHVQEATINIAGRLAVAVDETPFNLTPPTGADDPLYDANNSDDVIFGGWDDDFLHGGSGDDAILGGEALSTSYVQMYDSNSACAQTQDNQCAVGLVETDWYHPWNPGDILHFGADTNPWLTNHHIALRLGEFLLYDEYDPRRAILFNADGSTWSCNAYTPSGHTCTGSTALTTDASGMPLYQYFLNFDANDGRPTNPGCISLAPNGTCLVDGVRVRTDGNDAIFGDLGNDWLVGGTSNNDLPPTGRNTAIPWVVKGDTLWGGWGNDILIGNTGGDRLIDWVGEFNSYLVPFAPFGIATVSRQNDPQLKEFLYALSFAEGADPTRSEDNSALLPRNGEPNGEIGLVTQQDHGIWQQQTGSPSDPQAGNIPGGRRDVVRAADFNDGLFQGFAVDSGVWAVTGGALDVEAASLGQDAAADVYDHQVQQTNNDN